MNITFDVIQIHIHPDVAIVEVAASPKYFLNNFDRFMIGHDSLDISDHLYHLVDVIGPISKTTYQTNNAYGSTQDHHQAHTVYANSIICIYIDERLPEEYQNRQYYKMVSQDHYPNLVEYYEYGVRKDDNGHAMIVRRPKERRGI